MDRALTIKGHVLGPVLAGAPEPQRLQHVVEQPLRRLVDREFQERHAFEDGRGRRVEQLDAVDRAGAFRRRRRCVRVHALQSRPRLGLEIEDRLHRVDRGAAIGRLAKDVVENFERKRSGVPGDEHVFEKTGEVELALTRKAAVVPAPLEHVHREARRVGHLQEKNLLAGNVRNARRVVAE